MVDIKDKLNKRMDYLASQGKTTFDFDDGTTCIFYDHMNKHEKPRNEWLALQKPPYHGYAFKCPCILEKVA